MSRSKLKAASPEEVVTRIRASIPRQKRTTEIIGLGAVYVALIYLWMTASGTRHRYDKIVNFRLSLSFEKLSEMNSLLDITPAAAIWRAIASATPRFGRISLRDADRQQAIHPVTACGANSFKATFPPVRMAKRLRAPASGLWLDARASFPAGCWRDRTGDNARSDWCRDDVPQWSPAHS